MIKINKVSDATMANAKLGGSVPKKPKKPTGKLTEKKFDAYAKRYNDWAKKVSALADIGKKRADAAKKVDKMKATLHGV